MINIGAAAIWAITFFRVWFTHIYSIYENKEAAYAAPLKSACADFSGFRA